jgi:hypothetical protein
VGIEPHERRRRAHPWTPRLSGRAPRLAPVRSRSGEVVAAVNVAIPWSPVAMSELADRLGPVLRAAANEIAARMI